MRFEGYEVIVQYFDIEKKNNIEVHMQEKKSPRFCLFCGQDESKVKFTKIAHAVWFICYLRFSYFYLSSIVIKLERR